MASFFPSVHNEITAGGVTLSYVHIKKEYIMWPQPELTRNRREQLTLRCLIRDA